MNQSITAHLQVGYVSNFNALFYKRLFTGYSLASRYNLNRGHEEFDSDYGMTRTFSAPSEAAHFWYRFFPRSPHHIDSVSQVMHPEILQRELRSITAFSQRPLVMKNLHLSMRIEPLRALFPEAKFLWIKRDEIDNAASLYKARLDFYKNPNTWLSVEPPNIEQLIKLNPEQQVYKQVRSINEHIAAQLQNLPKEQHMCIEYEQFCQDTPAHLVEIATWLDVSFRDEDNLSISFNKQYKQEKNTFIKDRIRVENEVR